MNPRPPARKALDFGVRDHDSAADLEEADLALRGHLVDTRPRNAELRRSVFDPPCGWSDATAPKGLPPVTCGSMFILTNGPFSRKTVHHCRYLSAS
jgi:hypothetical protein